MSDVGQRSLIQGDTKILKVLNVLNLRGSKLYVPVFCLRDVYLIYGKHRIQSCLDLVAIAIDGSSGSDVQDQLRDLPRHQKMTHAGMLVQCHQHIGIGSIKLIGYRISTGTPLLSLRHLLLLSPRKTWKKQFDNILFSKFDSLTQEAIPPYMERWPYMMLYAALRSINTTPVLSLR
jgi:hypothetical protein